MKARFILSDGSNLQEISSLPITGHHIRHNGEELIIKKVVHLLDDDEADVEVSFDQPSVAAGVFLRNRQR